MTVLDDDPVLGLVCGLDLCDGHHDHVVVVAVADQLVTAALDDLGRAFVELESGGRVAFHEHVTARRLVWKKPDLFIYLF